MNTTNTETARQLNALAPKSLRYAGSTYRIDRLTLYEDATNTVSISYSVWKRGAFMASKVGVEVAYNSSTDLYDITVRHSCGQTFDLSEVSRTEGATWEMFDRLQMLVA